MWENPPKPKAILYACLNSVGFAGRRSARWYWIPSSGAAEISKLFPRVNLSTVYRTLELLCELGIAVEVEPNKDGDRRRYELVEGAEHYHLICENCEAEMELAPEVIKQLQAQIQERYNFQLKLPHFIGLGRCARCQEHKTTGQISPE
jgi:Fur family ferric uptake transcriptional regulator